MFIIQNQAWYRNRGPTLSQTEAQINSTNSDTQTVFQNT